MNYYGLDWIFGKANTSEYMGASVNSGESFVKGVDFPQFHCDVFSLSELPNSFSSVVQHIPAIFRSLRVYKLWKFFI